MDADSVESCIHDVHPAVSRRQHEQRHQSLPHVQTIPVTSGAGNGKPRPRPTAECCPQLLYCELVMSLQDRRGNMASADMWYLGDNRQLFDHKLLLQLNVNMLQKLNILSRNQTKYCRKLTRLLRTQAGTSLLPRVNCDVAVVWRIPPSNRSPSFEVSAIFLLRKIQDIFDTAKCPEYDVQKLIFYCLQLCHLEILMARLRLKVLRGYCSHFPVMLLQKSIATKLQKQATKNCTSIINKKNAYDLKPAAFAQQFHCFHISKLERQSLRYDRIQYDRIRYDTILCI